METKHTKGKWIAKDSPIGCYSEFIKTESDKIIAVTFATRYIDDFPDRYETIANAKLIAASPELLELSNELLAYLYIHDSIDEVEGHQIVSKLKDVINRIIL